MKPRKLKLVAKVMGMETPIAQVHIQNFANEAELKDWTDLVCPKCLEKPKYIGSKYECCGETYSWWGKLARVIKGTKEILHIPRLLKEKELAVGYLWKMSRENFAVYCDATKNERGVIVEQGDSGSAHNLFKMIVATERLNHVIIVTYKDTTEEVVALLKVSDSNRIMLKEIIPVNLAQMKETLMLDREVITEQDIKEAKAFLDQFIPEATEETLKVHDYRVAWAEGHIVEPVVKEPERVQSLTAIMAKVKQ